MPDLSPSELVRQIHVADGQAVVGITGGGSRAIAELLEVPGGSRTLLEAVVPYSSAALIKFLGGQPEQFCSARTARAMAMAAFHRARTLRSESPASLHSPAPPAPLPSKERGDIQNLVGVGCTASLVSDRPKRGAHRVHVAVQTAAATSTFSLDLVKDRRCRPEEEAVAAQMILNALAEGLGLPARLPLRLVELERTETLRTLAPQSWQNLLLGSANAVPPLPFATGGAPRVVFPGAFNPLHDGHRRMADIAGRRLNCPVCFEISIENVAKLPLDYTEMQLRAGQFDAEQLPLWFTRAPTFEEKSAIFPGATFIVGIDTLTRIGQPCFYHDDPKAAEAAIGQIAERGCRFLAFGRVMGDKFQTLDDVQLSPALRQLCEMVGDEEFRIDVSSTALRQLSNDSNSER